MKGVEHYAALFGPGDRAALSKGLRECAAWLDRQPHDDRVVTVEIKPLPQRADVSVLTVTLSAAA